MELLSGIVTLVTIRPEDSEAVFCIAEPKSPSLWVYLGVNLPDMPRTPFASEVKHSQ